MNQISVPNNQHSFYQKQSIPGRVWARCDVAGGATGLARGATDRAGIRLAPLVTGFIAGWPPTSKLPLAPIASYSPPW